FYERLLEEAPIHRIRRSGAYWVTPHELVKRVLSDKRFSVAFPHGEEDGIPAKMLNSDPPEHTRLRALVSAAFTRRRVELLRGRIGALATELLAAVRPQGQMDVVDDFAFPLPAMVIAEMLGVPPADREKFKSWSQHIIE